LALKSASPYSWWVTVARFKHCNTRTVLRCWSAKTIAIRMSGLGFQKMLELDQTGARKGLSFLSDLCLVF
jgi:hypothetical protein